LGMMLSKVKSSEEKSIEMFQEWRQNADELGIEPSKRSILYASYLQVYTNGKGVTSSVNVSTPVKKRVLKEQVKLIEVEQDSLSVVNQSVTDGSEEKIVPMIVGLVSSTEKQVSEKIDEKTEQTIEFEFGSDDESPKASVKTSNSHEMSAFKTVEVKICTICNKSTPGLDKLTKCGHYYHDHCLKNKACNILASKKFTVNCFKKDCPEQIERKHIVSLLSKEAKTCLDTYHFMNDFNTVGGEKTVFWCFRCRLVSVRFATQPEICGSCKNKMDILSNVMSLCRLVLSKHPIKDTEKKNHDMIVKCLTDCDQQITKCEDCQLWKHKFTSVSMKCQCKK
jgi:vacuolar-type H+-ATPase subunit F/Vma7